MQAKKLDSKKVRIKSKNNITNKKANHPKQPQCETKSIQKARVKQAKRRLWKLEKVGRAWWLTPIIPALGG